MQSRSLSLQTFKTQFNKYPKLKNFIFKKKILKKIEDFSHSIEKIFSNDEKFNDIRKDDFFKLFITSVKLMPDLPAFDLEEFKIIVRPKSYHGVDWKLFFSNNFFKVKLIPTIGENPLILVKYIYPKDNPNKSYLNWLNKTKKAFKEYYLFKTTKIYKIMQFETNTTPLGIEFDFSKIKQLIGNLILSNEEKKILDPASPKEISFSLNTREECLGPNSQLYQQFIDVYNPMRPSILKKNLNPNNSIIKKNQYIHR